MGLCNLRTRRSLRRVAGLAAIALAASLAQVHTASAIEKAVVQGAAAATQSVKFNIYLPLRDRAATEAFLTELHTSGSSLYHQWLTPAEFNERFGPQNATVSAISRELAVHGLEVTGVNAHSLQVAGTVAGVKSAFGVQLASAHFASGKQVFIAATPLKLTPTLAALGAVIPDFSGTIHMQKLATPVAIPQNRESSTGG
jgi:subtilase family serine protease